MGEQSLDRIYIRDLEVRCILGIYEEERREKQDIIINIVLYADLHKACLSDRIEDTVDYKTIKKKVLTMAEQSACYLVENLAEKTAAICLENPLVQQVTVCIDKPSALRFARSVAVEITRNQVE